MILCGPIWKTTFLLSNIFWFNEAKLEETEERWYREKENMFTGSCKATNSRVHLLMKDNSLKTLTENGLILKSFNNFDKLWQSYHACLRYSLKEWDKTTPFIKDREKRQKNLSQWISSLKKNSKKKQSASDPRILWLPGEQLREEKNCP